jgi:hypothetical protein
VSLLSSFVLDLIRPSDAPLAIYVFKATQVGRKEAEDIHEREKQVSVDANSTD